MKSCLFLLFFGIQSFSTQNLFPFAIHKIIRDAFVNQSESFDFIIYGPQSIPLMQLMNEIVKIKSGDAFAYKLIQLNEGKENIYIYRSAILFFHSLQSYQDFHARAYLENEQSRPFKFLVFINSFDDAVLEYFPLIRPYSLFRFETFITRTFESNLIKLTTFLTFQQPNCRAFVPVMINTFSESLRKWETEEYFIEKFKNYNGCDVVVLIPYQNLPYTEVLFHHQDNITDEHELTIKSVHGFALAVESIIRLKLNYYTFFNFFNLKTNQFYYPKVIFDYGLFISLMRKPGFNSSALVQPLIAVDSFIITSRSATYSNFERAFLPFEHEVWVCLTVTIAIGIIIIFALKLMSKQVQDFVFGSKVSTPLLCFM
jgi:hypothetical protein